MASRNILSHLRSRGAALVEYAILTGMIAVLVIVTILLLGQRIEGTFDTVAGTLASSMETAEIGGRDYLAGDDAGAEEETGPASEYNLGAPTGVERFETFDDYCINDPVTYDIVWCTTDGIEAAPEGVIMVTNEDGYGGSTYQGYDCAYDVEANGFIDWYDSIMDRVMLTCGEDLTGFGDPGDGEWPGNVD